MSGSENHFWTGVLVGAIVSPFIVFILLLFLSSFLNGIRRKALKEYLCIHPKTHFEDWPDGGVVQVCENCGMSQYHWEHGQSGWIIIGDIARARKEVEQALGKIRKNIKFEEGGKIGV